MAVLGFYFPPESGEKVTLGIIHILRDRFFEILNPAHWRHGHKKYLGLILKPIPMDIRNTF